MKNKLKPIPDFKNEDEERKFWDTAASSEYFDFTNPQQVSFPNLKPTLHTISMRLPDYLLVRLKEKANALNIPYQALIKQYIATGLNLKL